MRRESDPATMLALVLLYIGVLAGVGLALTIWLLL